MTFLLSPLICPNTPVVHVIIPSPGTRKVLRASPVDSGSMQAAKAWEIQNTQILIIATYHGIVLYVVILITAISLTIFMA